MSTGSKLSIAALAFLAGLAGAWVFSSATKHDGAAGVREEKESAYDRVMRTGTIRCGYMVVPPFLIKDIHTGAISGIFHDYVEALGQSLHLKIDWAEETGFGDFPAALTNARIDSMCSGIWPNASRARAVDFVHPIFYIGIYPYARTEDKRFDNHPETINSPSITVATIDGEMAGLLAAADFPKAKPLSLPQQTGKTDMFVNVETGKADVTFSDPVSMAPYMIHNPGKLRQIPVSAPLRVFGNTIAIAQGQDKFRRMLDTATEELLASGQIEKILAKYEQYPGTLLRVAPAYRETSGK